MSLIVEINPATKSVEIIREDGLDLADYNRLSSLVECAGDRDPAHDCQSLISGVGVQFLVWDDAFDGCPARLATYDDKMRACKEFWTEGTIYDVDGFSERDTEIHLVWRAAKAVNWRRIFVQRLGTKP